MLLALLMTLLAGGATTIGALIGITGRSGSDLVLTAGLGFSSGVMLYVSFVELLPQGARVLAGGGGATRASTAWAVLAFFGGIAAIALLDRLVPAHMNPHEMPGAEGAHPERARLLRTGLVTALALAIHNVPEGMATFVSALQSPDIAIPVVIAIALHNIPEGIAVALPVVRATGSRRRAIWLATLSGLAEPAGAVIGVLLLGSALQGPGMGAVLAAVAGVMVFVSLDELLPAAEEHGEHHVAIHSLVAGMALMALTLLIL